MLLHIHPFSSSLFFLSNFQILNIFVTLFSGTVRPRRLKLVTHVNNGWMYRVYQNETAAVYSFISLSLQFSNIQNFVALLSGILSARKLKLGTHMNNGWMYRAYRNKATATAAAAYSALFPFFFLSNFQRLIFFITLFSGTVRPRYWKLVTHVDCERMYHLYRRCCIPAIHPFISSFFFLSIFQTFKFFITFVYFP